MMYLNNGLFFVLLAAAGLMLSVIWGTRNWGGNTAGGIKLPKTDPEQVLLDKIYRLDQEAKDMQDVLWQYNNDETRQVYWELLADKTKAELEWQNKYCHSRKVPSFTRI